jgi:hypothetical protein
MYWLPLQCSIKQDHTACNTLNRQFAKTVQPELDRLRNRPATGGGATAVSR